MTTKTWVRPRHDPDRDKRIMDAAKAIKVLYPGKPMKICLLEAIDKDNKRQKVPDIFR